MSYQFYKILHIVSIVVYFAAFAVTVSKNDDLKLQKIAKGIFGLLIFVSGMGLIARIGLPHGAAWPLWIKLKLSIWTVVVVGAPIVIKRFTSLKQKFYVICLALLIFASYLANYKIS